MCFCSTLTAMLQRLSTFSVSPHATVSLHNYMHVHVDDVCNVRKSGEGERGGGEERESML